MKRILQYRISEETEGITVKEFIKSKGITRHILVGMKEYPDSILVNGRYRFLNQPLEADDYVTITIRDSEASEKIRPVRLPLSILHEDEDILIVNKPANMPVHPSMGNYENTLANAVAYYYAEQGETFVYRCINRLDRDTTGALILAKNALSAALLSQMMQRREIHRTYLAIVKGIPPKAGVIDAPIGRADGSAIERQIDYRHGETAVTHFQLLKSDAKYSLVQLKLETGRTHQIRVHMKSIGHPLPGDYLYHPDYSDFSHQPLHSWKLEFVHPIEKKPLHFTAAVPHEFQSFF